MKFFSGNTKKKLEYPNSKTNKTNIVIGSTTIYLPAYSRFVVARSLRHASYYRCASSFLRHMSTLLPVAPPPSIVRRTRSRVDDNVEEAIYELKRTSRERYHKFDKTISNFGFKKNIQDKCVYTKFKNGISIFLMLYVDESYQQVVISICYQKPNCLYPHILT